jgi:hypothetical protein
LNTEERIEIAKTNQNSLLKILQENTEMLGINLVRGDGGNESFLDWCSFDKNKKPTLTFSAEI